MARIIERIKTVQTWFEGGSARGQGVPLDALVGSIFFVGVVVIAIVSTGVSPTEIAQPTEQTFDSEIEKEVDVALAASHHDGSLKETVLAWNEVDDETGKFDDGSTPSVQIRGFVDYPDTAFGERLRRIDAEYSSSDANIINVEMIPRSNASGSGPNTTEPVQVITTTSSGGDTIVVSETVRLDSNDRLQSSAGYHSSRATPLIAGGANTSTITNADSYPIPEGDLGDSDTYNMVEVRVVILNV